MSFARLGKAYSRLSLCLRKSYSDFLKKYSEVKVQIQGYTDNQGSVAKNVALSDARAKSVMKSLVERGISLDRISAKGFGPADPVADNVTREGRQANRRVEFVKQ